MSKQLLEVHRETEKWAPSVSEFMSFELSVERAW